MAKLTEIIKEDLCVAAPMLRGVVKGAVQGIYTPALMNTGLRQLRNELDRYEKSTAEISAKTIAQIGSALGIHVSLASYAIQQGRGLEYFGALAVTNVIDYLVHAYKRSKE